FEGRRTGLPAALSASQVNRRENGVGYAGNASATRNSLWGAASGDTLSRSLYATMDANPPDFGSLCTINRRSVTSRTQYSTMWARAYSAALTVRSKVNVVSATSTTRSRSSGCGVADRNFEKLRLSTTKSGTGSFVGLSSGATSIGAS